MYVITKSQTLNSVVSSTHLQVGKVSGLVSIVPEIIHGLSCRGCISLSCPQASVSMKHQRCDASGRSTKACSSCKKRRQAADG